MKLNNKGFAISSIMYIILVLAVVLIALTLAILSSRKLILDKLKSEVSNNIYEVYPLTYRETLNILKEEAITYSSLNNIEKDSIKISNLESSIDSNTISGYKLSNKYLTMVSKDDTYDIYLGEEETITDISKPVENLMDIIDYKIYGNSIQDGKPTPDNPVEIKSVGDKSSNYVDLSKSVKSNSTSHVTFNYDNSTGTIELTSTPTEYDYVNLFTTDIGLNLVEGKTYYYGGDIVVSGKQTTNRTNCSFGLTATGETPKQYGFYQNETRHISGSFVYEGQETVRLVLNFNYGSAEPAQVKFENVYISEIGNEYEPYYEGYKIPIEVSGKNLFDIFPESWTAENYFNNGAWGWYEKTGILNSDNSEHLKMIKSLENKKITYSAYVDNTYGADKSRIALWVQYDDDSYPVLGQPSNSIPVGEKGWCSVTYDFSTLDIDRIKMINFGVTLKANCEGCIATASNGMVELGDTRTEYVPYIELVTNNIYLNEPLRKIGSYYDYIDLKNSKIVRNIYREFISKVNSKSSLNGAYSMFLTPISKIPKYKSSNGIGYALSNKFIQHEKDYYSMVNTGGYIQSYITSGGSNRIAYTFDDKNITTVEQAQEKIGNGFDVNYILNKAEEQTIELPKINTGIGTSMISVDTSILPSKYEFTVIKKIKQL